MSYIIITILVIGIIFLGIKYYALLGSYQAVAQEAKHVLERNDNIAQENAQLELDKNALLIAKEKIEEQIAAAVETSQAYTQTIAALEQSIKDKEAKAKADLNISKQQIQTEYQQYQAHIDQEKNRLNVELQHIEAQLKDLRAKQQAYIEQQRRKEQMKQSLDDYRLIISPAEQSDIALLRNMQQGLIRKEGIDKCIWEFYYRSAYDKLMTKIFGTKDKVCGIYKITDIESDKAYIGQSVDIKTRFKEHIRGGLGSGAKNKFYQALWDNKIENFTFEILEVCDRSQLNEREIYYINFYETQTYGFNTTRGGS